MSRAEFPIQLVGRLSHRLLLHRLACLLSHQFLNDFGALRLRTDGVNPELYHIRFLSFSTLKRLIFTMLALKPSSDITVFPTNFAKEAPPMDSVHGWSFFGFPGTLLWHLLQVSCHNRPNCQNRLPDLPSMTFERGEDKKYTETGRPSREATQATGR